VVGVVDLVLSAVRLDLRKRADESRATFGDNERLHLVGQQIHDAHAAVTHPGGLALRVEALAAEDLELRLGRLHVGRPAGRVTVAGDHRHGHTHKTFSTPHGGGGPGAGPIVVGEALAPFLPVPLVKKAPNGHFYLDYDRPQAIGKVRTFYGNIGVLVRVYTYVRALGGEGIRQVSEAAVLNANYVLAGVRDLFALPYDRRPMHEFVISAAALKEQGVRAIDVAKRLLDYGLHPPTTYFLLIVDEALMIEPTESESREALDAFVAALRAIVEEAHVDPEKLRSAPLSMPVRRLDEAGAARHPVLTQRFPGDEVSEAPASPTSSSARAAVPPERAKGDL
jgi:glycine cleavage system protein P-like pyridoxal-binding family